MNIGIILGAGSGILSITAKKMGSGKIDAVENDSECNDNLVRICN